MVGIGQPVPCVDGVDREYVELDAAARAVAEHPATPRPWAGVARRRWVECDTDGTFDAAGVAAALDAGRPPRLLAVTGASNVTGWLPPIDEIIAVAHERDVPVLV